MAVINTVYQAALAPGGSLAREAELVLACATAPPWGWRGPMAPVAPGQGPMAPCAPVCCLCRVGPLFWAAVTDTVPGHPPLLHGRSDAGDVRLQLISSPAKFINNRSCGGS